MDNSRNGKKVSNSSKNNEKNEIKLLHNRLIKILIRIINTKSGKARNEFRYNLTTGHYNNIFEVDEKNDEYHAIGLTSKPTTDGINNMKLSKNPQKGKTKDSYIRNGEIVASHSEFSKKPKRNMKFADEDIPNVKAKKRNAKKNIRRKKKENKKKK